MAEDDQQPGGIGLMDESSEASKEPQGASFLGQQQKGFLPLIYIGRKFQSTDTVITSIASGGRGYASADESIAAAAGRQVMILGLNLDKFESVALRIGNTQYAPLNLNIFPSQISFNINDYDNNLLSGGGVIRLEFLSLLNSVYNARLNNKLVYKTQKQVEESEKAQAGGKGGQAGQELKQRTAGSDESGVNFAKAFADSAGQIMGGSAGGFASGFGGQSQAGRTSPGVKAGAIAQGISSSATGGSVKTLEQLDMDADTELEGGEVEQTFGGEAEAGLKASTSGVSGTIETGGQTISQGGTFKQNVQISGGGTGQANVQVSAGGTAGDAAEAQVSTKGTAGVKAGITSETSAEVQQKDLQKRLRTEGEIKQATGANVTASGQVNISGTAQMGGVFSAVGGTASPGLNLGKGFVPQAGLGAQASAEQAQASTLTQEGKTGSSIQGQTRKTSEQLETAQKLAQGDAQGKKSQTPPDLAQGLSADKGTEPLAQGEKTEEPKSEDGSAKKGVLAPGEAKGQAAKASRVKGKNIEARPETSSQKNETLGKGEYQKELAAMKGRDRTIGQALGKGAKAMGEPAPLARPEISGGEGISKPSDRESGKSSGKEAPKPSSVPTESPQTPETELPGAGSEAPDSAPSRGQGMPLEPGAPLGLGDKDEAGQEGKEPLVKELGDEQDAEPKTERPAGLTPSPQSRQGAQAVAGLAEKEAAFAANQVLDKALLTGVVWVWGAAIPTFGLSVFLGAIVGDLVWLFKGWALNRIQRQSKLLSTFKNQNIQIELSRKVKLNIIAINLVAVILAFLILTLLASVIWGICNSKITYLAREYVGLEPYCKSIEQSFVGKGLNYVTTGTGEFQGSYNVPGSLIGTQKWTEAINTAAQKYNVDACVIRVVVQAESGGRENAVGCHCALGGRPQLCTPFQAQSSPLYNLNWQACGHDIGLTQVAIYPEGSTENYKKWCDPTTPSRFIAGACYTPTELLNPLTALDITSKVFSDNLQKSNGDIPAAFAAYVGQSSYTQTFVEQRMALYNLCVGQR